MSARSVGVGAMFGWIPATFRVVSRNFGAMALATTLTLLLGVLMALPMVLVMFNSMPGLGSPGVPPPADLRMFWIAYALTIVVGMVLMPPVMAGWFRLCRAADHGARPSGLVVIEPYRDGATWGRLLVYALLAMLMYLLALALIFLAFRGVFMEIMTMQAAQMAGGTPPPPSAAMIGKILLMYVVLLPTMMLLQFVYMVGLAEVSLRPTPALRAFLDAWQAVLRNALKLLLLVFCLFVGFGAVIGIFAVVIALLAVALSLISPVLTGVVIALLYVAVLLVVYPLMFAGNYYAWKDLLGDGGAPPPPVPEAFAA